MCGDWGPSARVRFWGPPTLTFAEVELFTRSATARTHPRALGGGFDRPGVGAVLTSYILSYRISNGRRFRFRFRYYIRIHRSGSPGHRHRTATTRAALSPPPRERPHAVRIVPAGHQPGRHRNRPVSHNRYPKRLQFRNPQHRSRRTVPPHRPGAVR